MNPRIGIKVSIIGRILNCIALLAFLSSLGYLIIKWPNLPKEVPSHYKIMGEPDNWGHKGLILIPLLIGIFLWVGFSLLEKYPHLHNHFGLTTENAERKYKNSSLMINFIKNEILLFFSYSCLNDVIVAKGENSLLGIWGFPVFLLSFLTTIAYFIIRSFQLK